MNAHSIGMPLKIRTNNVVHAIEQIKAWGSSQP